MGCLCFLMLATMTVDGYHSHGEMMKITDEDEDITVMDEYEDEDDINRRKKIHLSKGATLLASSICSKKLLM